MEALKRDYVVKFRDHGLLCLNVQARGGHVVAYSFARRPDGTPGPAERCGAINLGDQIVGVNDTNLTKLAFRDKVARLREALTNPQSSGVTLYFRRATEDVVGAQQDGASTRAAARRLKRANRAARVYTNVPEVEYMYVDESAAQRLRRAVSRAVNQGVTQAAFEHATCLHYGDIKEWLEGKRELPANNSIIVALQYWLFGRGNSDVFITRSLDGVTAVDTVRRSSRRRKRKRISIDETDRFIEPGEDYHPPREGEGYQCPVDPVTAPPAAADARQCTAVCVWRPKGSRETQLTVEQYLNCVAKTRHEQALALLMDNNYNPLAALHALRMVEPPAAFAFAEGWSQKEVAAFHTGIKEHGKLFNKIRDLYLPSRSVKEVVAFYYDYFKQCPDYATWKHLYHPTTNNLEFEFHGDECEKCKNGGSLLCCDSCNLAFHLSCVSPALPHVPKGFWACPQCQLNYRTPAELDAARERVRHRIAELEEKKKERQKTEDKQRKRSQLLAQKRTPAGSDGRHLRSGAAAGAGAGGDASTAGARGAADAGAGQAARHAASPRGPVGRQGSAGGAGPSLSQFTQHAVFRAGGGASAGARSGADSLSSGSESDTDDDDDDGDGGESTGSNSDESMGDDEDNPEREPAPTNGAHRSNGNSSSHGHDLASAPSAAKRARADSNGAAVPAVAEGKGAQRALVTQGNASDAAAQ